MAWTLLSWVEREERMANFQTSNTQRLFAEKEKVKRETEAVISRGEELLEHAHHLAEFIEKQVRLALGEGAESSSNSSLPSQTQIAATCGLDGP
jgi:hypothetical protein